MQSILHNGGMISFGQTPNALDTMINMSVGLRQEVIFHTRFLHILSPLLLVMPLTDYQGERQTKIKMQQNYLQACFLNSNNKIQS